MHFRVLMEGALWGTDVDAEQILAHLERLAEFLKSYERLWNARAVDFFLERQWESVDVAWLDALAGASMEDLLLLPSHLAKDSWPDSLKHFLREAKSLAIPRALQLKLSASPFPDVVSTGMNSKKMHEIGMLSSLIAKISRIVNATQVIDIGAGQGYLAQVLAFEYRLPVLAIDCSSHNATITNKRAQRIEKYYKSRQDASSDPCSGPKTVICRIGSENNDVLLESLLPLPKSQEQEEDMRSIVFAGLHACGDLSANMLRTFVQCSSVKALILVGCCYNLLSEKMQGTNGEGEQCGFPLSRGMQNLGLHIGGAGRDLGCQCAERWKDMGNEMASSNFGVQAFRAALQIVLHRFYPETAKRCPSIGRLGKAKRRKQFERARSGGESRIPCFQETGCFPSFRRYASAALNRLELPDVPTQQLREIWEELGPHRKFVGPVLSLRAAVAPVLETLLLLDRLLYLKEEEHLSPFTSMLLSVFDPHVSPRNMAVVAVRGRLTTQLSCKSALV